MPGHSMYRKKGRVRWQQQADSGHQKAAWFYKFRIKQFRLQKLSNVEAYAQLGRQLALKLSCKSEESQPEDAAFENTVYSARWEGLRKNLHMKSKTSPTSLPVSRIQPFLCTSIHACKRWEDFSLGEQPYGRKGPAIAGPQLPNLLQVIIQRETPQHVEMMNTGSQWQNLLESTKRKIPGQTCKESAWPDYSKWEVGTSTRNEMYLVAARFKKKEKKVSIALPSCWQVHLPRPRFSSSPIAEPTSFCPPMWTEDWCFQGSIP